MNKKTIGFIGFGNMAQAIARGIVCGELADSCELVAYNPTLSKITCFGSGVRACASSKEVAAISDLLFICVKPQMITGAFSEFCDSIKGGSIIVSVAAGVSVDKLKALAKRDIPVVRIMPNTPMLLGKGVSVIGTPEDVSDEDYQFICRIFRSTGWLYTIPNDKFDEIIPVSGSSIAVVFRLAGIIADCAEKNGIDYGTALDMFAKTLIGAAAMIGDSGKDISTLTNMVCSKGGTTLAMLGKLDEHGFEQAVSDSFEACILRAKELGSM